MVASAWTEQPYGIALQALGIAEGVIDETNNVAYASRSASQFEGRSNAQSVTPVRAGAEIVRTMLPSIWLMQLPQKKLVENL